MTMTATRILGMGCWKSQKADRHSSGWLGVTGITRTEILLFYDRNGVPIPKQFLRV